MPLKKTLGITQNSDLSDDLLNELRAELESRLVTLKLDMKGVRQNLVESAYSGTADNDSGNNADLSVEEQSQHLLLKEKVRTSTEYNNVVDALKKMDLGSYGICNDCGDPIPEKRLRATPSILNCLVCQEEFERETKC